MQKTLSDRIQEHKRFLNNVILELKGGNLNQTNIKVLEDILNLLESLKIELTEIKNKI